MIDIKSEQLLTLPEAARAVPPVGGKRPHTSTLFRWTRKGVRGGVKLECVRIGRKLCTSREALDRFFHAVTEAPAPEPNEQGSVQDWSRTPRQQERAVNAASVRLRASGFKGA